MDDRAQRIRSALSWSVVGQILKQGGNVAIMVALARLLGPSEFGLVAMVSVFSGLARLFVELGLGSAIIRSKHLSAEQLSTIFWLNLGSGVTMTLLFAAVSPWIAAYYGQPEVLRLTIWLGGAFTLNALSVVHRNLLARDLAFRQLALVESTSALGAGLLAVVLAARGAGAYSLVAQQLAEPALAAALLWLRREFVPRPVFRWRAIREQLGFGGHLVGFSVVNYFARNVDDAVVGRYFGDGPLGIYNRAYNLMLMPLREISAVVSRVMYPALAQIQDEHAEVRRLWLKGIRQISFITFPIAAILIVTAEPLVVTVFGQQWLAVAPVLQLLMPAGALSSIGTTAGWIYLSQGRSDWMLKWELVSASVRVAGIFAGLPWGIEGVAAGFTLSTLSLAYPLFVVPGKLVQARFRLFVKATAASLTTAACLGACLYGVSRLLPASWPPFVTLTVLFLLGLGGYAGLAWWTKAEAFVEFLAMVRGRRRA